MKNIKKPVATVIAVVMLGLAAGGGHASSSPSEVDTSLAQGAVAAMQEAMKLPENSIELPSPDVGLAAGAGDSGVASMRSLMENIRTGDYSNLSPQVQKSIDTAITSAQYAADPNNMDPNIIDFVVGQTENWQQKTLDAYVASLPPRDQERGRSVLLGNGTVAGSPGKMYIFVSRSMPLSMLRAYALEAFYTNSSLVVKGIRKGDTVKDYVEEVLEEFNFSDDQVLAGLEINPNLFDMFKVDVVPAVVWTNRAGLGDIGSGCQAPPSITQPMMKVQGPNEEWFEVEEPKCMPVPSSSYVKITGALKMEYVLERFEENGVPAESIKEYRQMLATRLANPHQGTVQSNYSTEMVPVEGEVVLDYLPRHLLESWQEDLQVTNVQKGPLGPVFGVDIEDDPIYRKDLQNKIDHQLGLYLDRDQRKSP